MRAHIKQMVTGREVLKIYGVQPFQLLEMVDEGLAPYDPINGRTIYLLDDDEYLLKQRYDELEDLLITRDDNNQKRPFRGRDSVKYQKFDIAFKLVKNEIDMLEERGVNLPSDLRDRMANLDDPEPSWIHWDGSQETCDKLLDAVYYANDLPDSRVCKTAANDRGQRSKPTPNGSASEINEKDESSQPKQAFSEETQKIPKYLDATLEYYAPEINIAIECWEALFINGGFKENGRSARAQARKWLDNKYGSLLEEAVLDRLATVANPKKFKRGGAPRTK